MGGDRIASLDALRGVAILCVVAAHLFGVGSHFFANAGVILFFFLSGFLMDRVLAREPGILSFASRRSFRILPMYWVSIVIVAAIGERWSLTDMLANATFTAPLVGAERMLGVYWTLYIEVLFYCLAPLVVAFGGRGIKAALYVALAIICAVAFTHGIGAGAPLYIAFCFCGMQIGAWDRGALSATNAGVGVAIASIIFGLLIPEPFPVWIAPPLCALLLVASLIWKPRFPPLAFVGTVSYSWYLLHTAFGYSLGDWQTAAVTFALSAATYFMIERPSIAIGRSLARGSKTAVAT